MRLVIRLEFPNKKTDAMGSHQSGSYDQKKYLVAMDWRAEHMQISSGTQKELSSGTHIRSQGFDISPIPCRNANRIHEEPLSQLQL